ncbi:unnamed protein product [Didymodactylos carnosus]|uniref:Uncharacterized protein n=1 Tax=Didymodactylos carnosus TaxID=1234261 RepID=A0A814KQI6_9BILA|nr:unnamed protein product [Didymodactylos carnosus]CAF1114508.1 unnamed protein product [Didymodactylos carnosus]CAF3824628.1 unnamed protein product [Didymodactylos carnosus]CAF3883960.1 unnamed protein product [Didymodactylos carnosus]
MFVNVHSGAIKIDSKGAYVARAWIDFRDAIGTFTYSSGNIYAGKSTTIQLPEVVEWVQVRVENQRLVGKWNEVFRQEMNGPRNLCYTVGGTTFHPNFSGQSC